jgi:hypothetical protein
MAASHWTEADTLKAQQIWAEYQRQHDLSDRKGQTAGIDPASGRVWFGESAKDIWLKLVAEGKATPLYYVRVGYDYYVHKVGKGCQLRHELRPERVS